jgi:uncharacterized membrane protein YidH (DUF202 family)
MAGFAFAALFYFITASPTISRSNAAPESDADASAADRRDLAAQALGAAFGTLLLSSITYAVLAGEPRSAGRAATIEVIAGIGFAVGAIHLFYAIVLMIRAHQQEGSNLERYFQNLGGLFLCPLAALMIDLGVSDWEETKHDHAAKFTYHLGLWIALVVAVICIMLAILRRKDHNWSFSRFCNPAYWAVAIGGAAIVATSGISVVLEECTPAAPGVMDGLMIVTAIVLVNQSLWFYWPPESFQSLRRR